jgi:hypothetical protein
LVLTPVFSAADNAFLRAKSVVLPFFFGLPHIPKIIIGYLLFG